MASKSKSGLSETPAKASPATPRVSKLSRGVTKSETDSPSPLQNSRLSVERSPRSINSKPSVTRSPKVATPPEKPHSRVAKSSEIQAQLSQLQEDLKKAKEQIALIEKEKEKALDELREAQKVSEDANEKLQEALVAQKRAEEDSEIEKFRAVELEQAGIEAAQKKEEDWKKELESVRNQHALDVAALLSTTQELQSVKQEHAMTCDAKNQALSHADDATKIAEIHAEKVEILSSELTRLKALLDSKHENEAVENNEAVLKLKSEIEILKQELDKARGFEEKLIEKEGAIEQLNVDLEAARMAESYACNLVAEWKHRVEELEMQADEAKRLERSASESLDSVMKQLEGNNDLLHDAESEITALKEKVGLLEMTIGRQRGDLEESTRHLGITKEEISKMANMVESLKIELLAVQEEKAQALNNEKLAASSVQNLLEEKNKLINELESSREEEEKSKKAMESLASALHEVSAEAREAKEKLLSSQIEHDDYESQIEDLRLVLKATNEKYENMLGDAKHEIAALKNSVEQSKEEFESSKAEWEQKELHLMHCVNKSEEENTSMEKEINRLVGLLQKSEEEASTAKEEEAELKDSLKEVEAEVIYLQETLGEAKAETMKLKEGLLDKETELQGVIQENEELRARETASLKENEELRAREATSLKENEELRAREAVSLKENEELRAREAASLKKIEELSKLLEEALANKQTQENGELTDSEKDYDLLPKVVEFSEENGHGRGEEKPKMELTPKKCEEPPEEKSREENNGFKDETVHLAAAKTDTNGKPKEDESKEKDDDSVEVEFKMWESCTIEKKEASPEREPEQESFEEEVDSKVEGGNSSDQMNGLSSTENIDDGGSSPTKQQQQKKKKPLLRKFGNLLKKKGASNQK